MDWLDYRKKLGLDFEDNEKGYFCIALILNKLDDLSKSRKQDMDFMSFMDFDAVSDEEYKVFCTMTGTEHGDIVSTPEMKINKMLIANKSSFKSFLAYFIAFINCLTSRQEGIKQDELLGVLDKAFEESKLKYALLKDEDKYFVFPKGAKELDDALVSEPLEWLKEYPQAYKTYCNALKQYSDGIYIRDVADNLRKAFEEFLREFLVNNNDLNKNKKEIENYLKSKNADPQLITMLVSLISHYYLLNNEVAKHNDKIDEKYLEFLLYQTGVFIRMLLVVKNAKEVSN